MGITPVRARTITRLSGVVDPWFLARYGMNLYRGCAHGCAYCDGRGGYALQAWARSRLGRRGAPIEVERELDRRLADGTIVEAAGLPASVLPVLRELASELPALPPDPQLGLFNRPRSTAPRPDPRSAGPASGSSSGDPSSRR